MAALMDSTSTSLDYGDHSPEYSSMMKYGGQSVFPQTYDKHYEDHCDNQLRASSAASSFEDFFSDKSSQPGVKSKSAWNNVDDTYETSRESGWNKFQSGPSGNDMDSDDSSLDMDLMDKFSTHRHSASNNDKNRYGSLDSGEQHNVMKSGQLGRIPPENNHVQHSTVKSGQWGGIPPENDNESDNSATEVESPHIHQSDHNLPRDSNSTLYRSQLQAKAQDQVFSMKKFTDDVNDGTKSVPLETERSDSPVSLDEFTAGHIDNEQIQTSYDTNAVEDDIKKHKEHLYTEHKPYSDLDTERSDGLINTGQKQMDDLDTDRTDASLNTEVLLKDFEEKVLVNSKYRTTNHLKSKPRKSIKTAEYNSDIGRKYQAYQSKSSGATSTNALKRDFVNEMLSRAQNKHMDDNYYKSCDESTQNGMPSGEYSKNYPRGVTLSKTFTKASNYRSGSLKWNSGKYEELAYGPSNIFNNKRSKSGNLTKYSHTDVKSNGWTVHEQHKQTDDNVFDSTNDKKAPDDLKTSVIDESYYRNILQSSKISKPSESSGEIDIDMDCPDTVPDRSHMVTYTKPIPDRSNMSTTYTKPVKQKSSYVTKSRPSSAYSKSKTDLRPDSVLSIRSESVLSQATIDRPDSALSVQGIKQDTGPKKPKSTAGRYRTNHTASYVDETLFGKSEPDTGFEAPWGEPNKVGKKPLPYVAITSMEPHLDRKTIPPKANSSSRPPSAKHRPVSASTKKKQTKELHNFQNAYVDEMLFGKPDTGPSFKAPWDNEREPKPHAFDGTDYRAGSANSQRKKQTSTENKKPVWK